MLRIFSSSVSRNVQSLFNRSYSQAAASSSTSTIPEGKLAFTLALPHQVLFNNAFVDSVHVPSVAGRFGVLPHHTPIVAELNPGVITVANGSETSKYFVSSGFVVVHENSRCEISAVEAIPLEALDKSIAISELDTAQKAAAASKTEEEKAEHLVLAEAYQAIVNAVDGVGY